MCQALLRAVTWNVLIKPKREREELRDLDPALPLFRVRALGGQVSVVPECCLTGGACVWVPTHAVAPRAFTFNLHSPPHHLMERRRWEDSKATFREQSNSFRKKITAQIGETSQVAKQVN